jgi:tetratricopeptide (TPR) repeat protein
MKRQLVLAAVLLVSPFCTNRGWAQRTQQPPRPLQIRGQIRLPDNRPLPVGTTVSFEIQGGGIAGQAQTDTQGKFEFHPSEAGSYEIHVNVFGFLPETQEVDLRTVPTALVNITLKPDPKRKEENPVPPGGPGATIAVPLDPNAPDDARNDMESGRSILSGGKDLDKSIKLFQKAIARYPQYCEAYLLMGVAYSSQKKWDNAEKALQKSIELNKNAGGAYVALGSVENERKEYSQAEKYLLKGVELAPNSPDAHFELGRAYWGQQRWDVADQHVSKANQLRPGDAGQHVMMGNILLRERDAMGALKEYKQAVQIDPKGPLATPSQQMVDKIEAALKQAEAQKK